MKLTRTHAALVVLAVVAFVAALAVGHAFLGPQPATQLPAAAARTSFPGLEPAAAEPQLSGLDTLRPSAGEVLQAPGPFDDRFVLRDLRLDGAALYGTAEITSDVSDVLEFEALAGFYDAQGRLLGTGRFSYHLDEAVAHEEHDGPPSELEAFSIPVPAEAHGAVSAAVGVPVLVNE